MIKVKVNIDLNKQVGASIAAKKAEKMKSLLDALKKATPVDTGNARDSWEIRGDSLVNTADYIEHLNEGSSKQAPSHFIEKELLAQPGVFPKGTIVRSE